MGVEQGNVAEEMRVLIADRIAQEGIDLLRSQLPEAQIDVHLGLKPEHIRGIVGDYTALIVRSETQVTSEILAAAKKLKLVGRARAAADDLELDAATRQGRLDD